MSEFDIFDNMVKEYSNDKLEPDCSCIVSSEQVYENGIVICTTCGEQVNKPLLHDKEWRFYGNSDGKRSSDPTRVHARKIEEKNIFKDVENMQFSETIIAKANEIYTQVTNGQIFRGGSRKSIIFACIFHAYKLSGNHQTPDNLIKTFGLTRKAGLKGLKIVNVSIPHDSEIHNTTITSEHIIKDIMNKFITTEEQHIEVCNIHNKIKNRSTQLNRARPQSIASAVIYFWIVKNNIPITISDFAKTAGLSVLTIQKNMKEVENVFYELKT